MTSAFQFTAFTLLALFAQLSHAAPTTTVNARVSAGGLGILDETVFNNSGSTTQTWSGSAGFSSPFPTISASGSAAAGAFADFGVLKVSSAGTCNGGCGATAFAAVNFSDELVIDRVGFRGQTAYLTTTVEYFWTGNAVNEESFDNGLRYASYAEAGAGFLLSGLGSIWADELAVAGGVGRPSRLQISDASGVLQDAPFSWRAQVTTPFAFGNTLPFSVTLSASSYAAGAYGPDGNSVLGASARLAADRSAYWGGIVVRLADGTVIDDYTLASGSGTDWRSSFAPSPIPEPNTLVLTVFGLCTVAWLTRARRSRK